MPRPEFELFELAVSEFQDDEGTWFVDVVQVIGMEINGGYDLRERWTYMIRYVSAPSEPHINPGFREQVADYGLRKFNPAHHSRLLTA